jgi:CheY-like chemotaxis protein
MRVLIVESNRELGTVWKRHIERRGVSVTLVAGQVEAVEFLQDNAPSVIIMNLVLDQGSAFAVADYAAYRRPDSKVIFVTSASFFSDGSIFRHIPNACAFMPSNAEPGDLAAVVDFYGEGSRSREMMRPN